MRKPLIFSLVVFLSVFTLNAQVSSKDPQYAKTPSGGPKLSEQSKEKLSTVLIEESGLGATSGDMLQMLQFFSGPDTIVLSPEKKVIAVKDLAGNVGFKTLTDVKVIPGTPGVIVPGGISIKNGKIASVKVSFWSDEQGGRDDLFLEFGPAADSLGTFVLYVGTGSKINFGPMKYTLVSGGSTKNPLFMAFKKLEFTPPVAPGRKKG